MKKRTQNKKIKIKTAKRKYKKLKKSKRKTRKTKINNKSRKKRGSGQSLSRLRRRQVIEDNESDYSDDSNPDPVVAEIMQDNVPLPPGAQRFPTIQYPSASAEIPTVSTEISLDTNDIPDLQARVVDRYNSKLYNTKLGLALVYHFYDTIYDAGKIEEDTEEIELELVDALKNYVYHVNYFDPYNSERNGNRNKIGSDYELYHQLKNLINAWINEDGEIEQLLEMLRSDPYAEIRF
tara:strand:+ start:715 stop:1422 length:708 start_codon:yes stop_codon:yes gene_type:complete